MRKLFFCLAVLSLVSAGASAQKSMDEELNTELDKMYEQSKIETAAPAKAKSRGHNTTNTVIVTQAAPVVTAPTVTAAPVVATPVAVAPTVAAVQVAPAVQKQAVTVIEATPLVESKADKIRKARQETELQTEQKIVEKLETSRMDDEKKRAEVLFGDKFTALAVNSSQAPAVATPVAVAPAPVSPVAPVVAAPVAPAPVAVMPTVVPAPIPTVVAPVPVVVMDAPAVAEKAEKKEDKLSREDVRQELKTALDEARLKDEAKRVERKTFFSMMGGMGDYNNNNVTGQYSFGVGVGQKINDRMLVEGQFNYADYHVQNGDGVFSYATGLVYPRISNMEQYQGLLAAKYQILGGSFRPLVGVAAGYTYRKYSDIQFGNSADTGSSHALDLGLLCGADLEMNENFSLGLEIRYMWNIMNRRQIDNALTPSQTYIGSAVTPENMGNMNVGLTGRVSF